MLCFFFKDGSIFLLIPSLLSIEVHSDIGTPEI